MLIERENSTQMTLTAANEAIALIHEFAEPVPRPLRPRFLERVSALLSGDEILSPAKVMEACRQVQIELRVAPAVDLDEPPPLRSPHQRRAR
jgi:hypothetical protein